MKRGCEEHCVDFKIHDNFHQQGTARGVGGVWHRGTQAKYSSLYTPSQVRGSILVKAHVLSGNDAVSKVGTKHAALTCTNEVVCVCRLCGETRKCKCKANGHIICALFCHKEKDLLVHVSTNENILVN